jgi:PAS domain S-box-containing protein
MEFYKSVNGKKTILLVEDEAILALSEKKALEGCGYAVQTVGTGEKAVEAVNASADIDLILMDIDLGKGIDGTQAAGIIAKDHDIPIVFLSSHTDPEVVEKTEKITSYGYVVKATGTTVLDSSIKMAFKLFESRTKFQKIFNMTPALICVAGTDGYFKELNSEWEKTLGYTLDELGKIPFTQLIHPDDIGPTNKEIGIQLDGGETLKFVNRYRHKDGSYKYLEWRAIPSENGTLIASALDVSERRKSEAALRESEEDLKTAQSISHIGSWKWGVESGEVEWSDEMFRIFGIDKETNTGRLGDIAQNAMHPDDLHIVMPDNAKNIADNPFEYRIVLPDGSVRNILAKSGNTVFDGLGRPLRMSGVAQDITERKKAEERIESLLAEKELLLKEVHHRIKNNMNTISSLLSLQAQTLQDPSAIEALEDANHRVRSMGILYDKLYRSADFVELSVRDYVPALVDEIIGNFPNRKTVRVEKRIDDFMLDAKRLQPLGIIINELLTNIMKYAFRGRESGLVTVSVTNAGGHVNIVVQDDGIGIPESVSIEDSAGFGLRLIHALARQLDGTIRMERENGTKVVFGFER